MLASVCLKSCRDQTTRTGLTHQASHQGDRDEDLSAQWWGLLSSYPLMSDALMRHRASGIESQMGRQVLSQGETVGSRQHP